MWVWLLALGCQPDLPSFIDPDKVGSQPNPPRLATPEREDVISQLSSPRVDILWVIDNSGSMGEEQQKLKDNFDGFIRYFVGSGLDWHVGVVSTDADADRGHLRGAGGALFLTPDTPNPIATFRAMATLGVRGSGQERGLRAVQMALTEPAISGANAGFYRPDASLHVIVISDEQDFSGGDPSTDEVITLLQALQPDPDRLTFSSIVGPPEGCATADPGRDYLEVTATLGGIAESICLDDWSPLLAQLGLQAIGLRREYFLSEMPVPGTLRVWVEQDGYVWGGVDEASGQGVDGCTDDACFLYRYDALRNSVTMADDFLPDALALVHLRYELLTAWQPDSGGGG